MQHWIAGWKEQIHQEATKEAFSDHHVVFKIHCNIKRSLRETIKGKKPPEHIKHHLELCPGRIRPPSPASPPLPPPLIRFSLRLPCRSFPSFPNHVYCSTADLDFRPFIRHLSHSRLSVVSRATCNYQKLSCFPVEMFRGVEEVQENKLRFNAVLAQCPCLWGWLQQENNNTKPEKLYSLPYSHFNALAS